MANQYSTVCLRTPTAAAISSSETASTPRAPNSSTPRRGCAPGSARRGCIAPSVYHLVENRARPVARDRRGARRQTHRHHRVHRLRRHGARRAPAALRPRLPTSCCSSATASGRRRPSASSASCSRTTPSTGSASSTAATASRQMTDERITTIRGDVGRDGLGLSADDQQVLASCDVVIHSAATVSFDSPLDSAVEINLLGPTRIATLLGELGVTPHLVAVSTCYVAGNRRGNAPEELVSRGPVRPRAELARRGHRRPPAAQRHRGGQPAARSPRRVPRRRPPRARRGRRSGAGRQDRAAPRAVGARPARRGRAGAGGERRLAGRLRLHQGARRAGADRFHGRRAGEHRPPVDHRVGVGRAAARVDPRLPHGRAGDHLLRPRPAARVPRRSRGHGRRDPRRPRRRRDHHRRRPRSRRGAADHPGRVRRRSTRSSTARSSTTSAAGSSSTRSTTPPASRSSSPSGASPGAAGCRASSAGPRR